MSSKGAVRILLYHDIGIENMNQFESQISYLISRYNFMTPLEFESVIDGKTSLSGINLVLTFDDGFKSNIEAAKHVLKKYNIKGFFFIPYNFMGLTDTYSQKIFVQNKICDNKTYLYKTVLNIVPLLWDDIKILIDMGHTIGCHSANHTRLSSIKDNSDLYQEIIESANLIERKIGLNIDHFAYPFGDINSINSRAMEFIRTRYKFCFSGIRGFNYTSTSSYAIKRDSMPLDAPLDYIHLIIEGGLDIMYRKKVDMLQSITKDNNRK